MYIDECFSYDLSSATIRGEMQGKVPNRMERISKSTISNGILEIINFPKWIKCRNAEIPRKPERLSQIETYSRTVSLARPKKMFSFGRNPSFPHICTSARKHRPWAQNTFMITIETLSWNAEWLNSQEKLPN